MLLKLAFIQWHIRALSLFLARDRGDKRCCILLVGDCSNMGNAKELFGATGQGESALKVKEENGSITLRRAHTHLRSKGQGSLWLYLPVAFVPNPSWQWPFASHLCGKESQGLMVNCVENCGSLGRVTFKFHREASSCISAAKEPKERLADLPAIRYPMHCCRYPSI